MYEPASPPRRSVRVGLVALVTISILLMLYRVSTELHLTHAHPAAHADPVEAASPLRVVQDAVEDVVEAEKVTVDVHPAAHADPVDAAAPPLRVVQDAVEDVVEAGKATVDVHPAAHEDPVDAAAPPLRVVQDVVEAVVAPTGKVTVEEQPVVRRAAEVRPAVSRATATLDHGACEGTVGGGLTGRNYSAELSASPIWCVCDLLPVHLHPHRVHWRLPANPSPCKP